MRAGRRWLGAAFALYRKNPALILSASMAYWLAGVVLALLGPLVLLLPIIQPSLMVLLANVYAAVHAGKVPQQADLMFAVVERRPALIRLGLFQFAASAIFALLSVLIEWLADTPTDIAQLTAKDVLLNLLPLFIVMIPVFMAFCFAPVLTAWHNMPPAKAMFFSFVATWRNVGAFVMHFLNCLIVIMAAGFLRVLIAGLFPAAGDAVGYFLQLIMLLAFVPMLMASVYIAYREIFETMPAPASEAEEA
ncbi:MAG TPA: BPSS1780 family membrane protein [Rhodocyclaceae bacterium]|nr:BPSS1780 family membrane protein [Rhodocyclaceae bacterium]